MNITAGKLFAIGNLVLTTLSGATGVSLATGAGLSQAAAAYIVLLLGVAGVLWNGIGTILLSPEQQAQAVAANIEDPIVKKAIVPAVADLDGLEPLQTNAKADATLKAIAADDSIKKVLPLKL